MIGNKHHKNCEDDPIIVLPYDLNEWDDYDENYPACDLCGCRIGYEVPFGADGVSIGEVYCERCAKWSGLI